MLSDFFTKKDMHNMMFLDTTKGVFDIDDVADRLLEDFAPTVLDMDKFARRHLMQQTHTDMELSMRNITTQNTREKSNFVLYNTMNFLLDESLPSFERIAQDVILKESNIATRMIEHATQNDVG